MKDCRGESYIEFELSDIVPKFLNTTEKPVVYALLPGKNGKIRKLVEPEMESSYNIDWTSRVGDTLKVESLVNAVGVLKLKNNDSNILYRDFEKLTKYQPVLVENN